MIQRRLWATLAVGSALALGVTGVATTAASADSGQRTQQIVTPGSSDTSGRRTLHIVSTTLVQTGPSPAAGAQYTFYDADSGDDTGNDLWVCAQTDSQGDGICYGQFNLSRGSISATTVGNLAAPTFQATGEITGGTGAYAGARGTIVASGTLAVTPFTFYFN